MRKSLIAIAFLMGSLASSAQTASWTADNGNGTFTNPLFYDEFSDPDILRVGDDYYLAGTTMHTVPGLVILHSRDLVNWENISYCFDRFDFDDDAFSLKNHQEIYGQGIWAQRTVLRFLECQWQGLAVLYKQGDNRSVGAPQYDRPHLRSQRSLR